MSQYLHIFIQSTKNENDFIPIGCYSASTEIYRLFHNFAPFERIRELDINYLKDKLELVRGEIRGHENDIKSLDKRIMFIQGANNALSDKLEEYSAIESYASENKDYLNEKIHVEHILSYLIEICSESIDETDWNKRLRLFAGIECGYAVTRNDIEGE